MKAALFLGPGIPALWMSWSVVSAVPPLISDVRLFAAPNRSAPFAATLTCSTDRPTRVSLTISRQDQTWTVTPHPGFKSDHSVVVRRWKLLDLVG